MIKPEDIVKHLPSGEEWVELVNGLRVNKDAVEHGTHSFEFLADDGTLYKWNGTLEVAPPKNGIKMDVDITIVDCVEWRINEWRMNE